MTAFIEIKDRGDTVYTVNASHIIKMFYVTHNGDTWTRIILAMGGGMIDSPLVIDVILNRIKTAIKEKA